ncbi:tumor necrosis factor receptor superfamily member 4-like [Ornithodoros turicata]
MGSERLINAWLFLLALAASCFVLPVHCHRRHRHGNGLGCSKCPPGSVVMRPCGHGLDTECTPCHMGQYMPHHSHKRHCFPCSLCGEGLFEAHPCTSVSDTVCDSCHTVVKAPHSANFYVKCVNDTSERWELDDTLPSQAMLVSSAAFSHMRHEDRTVPVVQQLRPHHQKVEAYQNGEVPLSFGAGGGGIVTAVISLSVVFGLILAVVLSRWRSTSHVPDRAKHGYMVVAQKPDSCCSSV